MNDLRAWVEQAGLMPGEVMQLGTPPGMGALVARVPLQEASGLERSGFDAHDAHPISSRATLQEDTDRRKTFHRKT